MFATLAGAFPHARSDADPEWRHVLVVQVESGLGLLSDGLVHDEPGSDLAERWSRTRRTADELGIELPLKVAVLGPWARVVGDLALSGVAHGVAPATDDASAQRATPSPDAVGAEAAELRRAIGELAEVGCPVVEVHEPSATLPDSVAGVEAFLAGHVRMLDGLPADLHVTLAVTGGDTGPLDAAALAGLAYRSFLLDVLDGPEAWRVVAALPGDRGVILGVGDASGRRRTGLEALTWAAQYAASTGGRGSDRVGLAPSGGLVRLAPEAAREVIESLGEAARLLSGDQDALLHRMDPRAIDLRSAALGEYRPDRRSRRSR